jgi:threonine aldolase
MRRNKNELAMIDLRSDTVTQPCAGMRDAMANARVGDDVYGDDPTVAGLEAKLCEITQKEAAVFITSGTQSNLCALLSHCARGDEYIAGQDAHTYRYEAGGAAVLGGIQPQPVLFNARGELPLDAIQAVIKPDDPHFARTKLLCLENTQGGKALSLSYLAEATALARKHHLNCHLDGARLFNAALATNASIGALCQPFDTVSICLSKGLGTPMGSVLVGSDELINRARRWRKMLGGGLRQSGIVAAAGLFALEHNVARLIEDHQHADAVARALNELTILEGAVAHTNMVFLNLPANMLNALQQHLKDANIIISGARWVFHKDVTSSDVDHVLEACRAFAKNPVN